MATNLPDIGNPPSNIDSELRRFLLRLREHVRELRGIAGDAAGAAGSGTGTGGTPVAGPPGPQGPSGPPGSPAPPDPPDPTPPPMPSGVTVLAGLTFVSITTDAPIFTQGHGYGRTIVYAAKYLGIGPLPTFVDAVVVTEFVGQVGDFASEPNTQWHVWVKWRSADGYDSATPHGGTNGTQVTTGQDVTNLLSVLSGQITTSQLNAALNTRIDLIDAPAGTAGSVNARIATEASARTAGDAANASSITTLSASLSSVNSTLTAAIASEQSARISGDAANSSAITTVQSRLTSRPNLLPNGGFENGLTGWTPSSPSAGIGISNSLWGQTAVSLTSPNGTFSLDSQRIPCQAGEWYTIAGDSLMLAGSGSRYFDIVFFNASNVVVGDGPQNPINAPSDFSAGDANRSIHAVEALAPAGATQMMARFVWSGTGITAVGCRQIKLERGRLPYTPYTMEGVGVTTAASVQQEISTRATADGYLGAQYTLRLDVGGRVVGFGFSNTSAPGAGPTSDFQIVTDRFSVVPPAGVGAPGIVPFVVQASPVTTPAGEVLPAGVYMNATYIRNLEAVLARFNQAIITNAMIVDLSVSKLKAGSLAVGEFMQSSAYSPGGTGFRLGGDGNVDIANAGRSRVFNLGASGTQPVLKVGSQLEIQAGGSAFFGGDINARGTISGGSHTSAYAWPASGGGFHLGPSGLLLGNVNVGGYFQVTSGGDVYAPQFSIVGGVAQLSAAAVNGQLSAGNIVGASLATSVTGGALSISGGRASPVPQLLFSSPPELTLETPNVGDTITVTCHADARLNFTTKAFGGSGADYFFHFILSLRLEFWNGSSWVENPSGSSGTSSAHFKRSIEFAYPNDVYDFPAHMHATRRNVARTYTKVRAQLVCTSCEFVTSQAFGSVVADVINVAGVSANITIQQTPN